MQIRSCARISSTKNKNFIHFNWFRINFSNTFEHGLVHDFEIKSLLLTAHEWGPAFSFHLNFPQNSAVNDFMFHRNLRHCMYPYVAFVSAEIFFFPLSALYSANRVSLYLKFLCTLFLCTYFVLEGWDCGVPVN